MVRNNMVIGVDFDNTITNYDELMHELASKQGWIKTQIRANKQEIRDHIRSLDNGEIKWQELQAMVYGEFMYQAKLIDGVQDFFSSCYKEEIPIFIVSHKTQFAAQDKDKIDMHKAALSWLNEKRFFKKEHVFFEPTRQKKIERIEKLGCTHFIDDLLETFLEAAFPKDVQKILYAPHGAEKLNQDILVKHSWEEIYDSFFTNIRK